MATSDTSTASRVGLALLLAASSFTIMAAASVAPALPDMREAYASVPGVDVKVPLTLTLPGLVIAAAAPLSGLVADRWGRTRLLLAGLLLYAVSGVSGFFAASLEGILIGRAFLGLAVAMIMTTVSVLIIDYSRDIERWRMLGRQASIAGFGGLIFPLVGGLLAVGHWRLSFLLYLLPIFLVVPIYWYVRDVHLLKQGGRNEKDLTHFPVGDFLIAISLGFCGMLVLYAIPLMMPRLLQELGANSAMAFGAAIGIPSCAAGITAFFYSRIRSLFDMQTIASIAFGLMAVSYALISAARQVELAIAFAMIAGVGFGLNTPNLTTWMQSRMPMAWRGRAAGALTSAIFLGQFSAAFVYSRLERHASIGDVFFLVASSCFAVSAVAAAAVAVRWRPDCRVGNRRT